MHSPAESVILVVHQNRTLILSESFKNVLRRFETHPIFTGDFAAKFSLMKITYGGALPMIV